MLRIMAHTPHRLPAHKPRYLMGVGTPEDLVEGVAHGVDMFDCVMPTRNARNGHLFTRFGDLRLRNARYKDDERPIDETCSCHACGRLHPRLPAPPGPLRRDAGPDAGQHPQPALLPEPDARDARGARRSGASPPCARSSRPTARAASSDQALLRRTVALLSGSVALDRVGRANRGLGRPLRSGPDGRLHRGCPAVRRSGTVAGSLPYRPMRRWRCSRRCCRRLLLADQASPRCG